MKTRSLRGGPAALLAVLLLAFTAESARGDFLVLKNGKSFGGTLKEHKDGGYSTSETKYKYARAKVARASRKKTAPEVIEAWSRSLGDSRAPAVREAYLSLAKFCMYQQRYDDAKRFFGRTGRNASWRVFTSKNYFILSNTKDKRVKEVRDRLDAIVAFYQKEFGAKRQPRRDFVVRFFRTEAGFDAYSTSVGVSGAGAFYSPRLGELVLWDASLTNKQATFEAVYHEANHQFVGAFYLDHEPEHGWFGEGLATYYESAKYKSGRIVSHGKKQRSYQGTLKQAFRGNQLVPWRTFLAMKLGGFYCGGQREAIHYAQAWGLVYFLKNSKDPRCREFLEKYVAVLRETKDDAAALAAAYEVASCEEIGKRFKAFARQF